MINDNTLPTLSSLAKRCIEFIEMSKEGRGLNCEEEERL